MIRIELVRPRFKGADHAPDNFIEEYAHKTLKKRIFKFKIDIEIDQA